jgi:hypothetical protein
MIMPHGGHITVLSININKGRPEEEKNKAGHNVIGDRNSVIPSLCFTSPGPVELLQN